MNKGFVHKHLPEIVVGVTILFFWIVMLPPTDSAADWHFHDFGRLPVLDNGRYKPLDTVARNTLMVLTHRQSYAHVDEKTEKTERISANKWMLDVMTSPTNPDLARLLPKGSEMHPAWDYKVFRIENDQLITRLDLKMRDGLRYSFNELLPKFEFIREQAERVDETPAKDRSLFDSKLYELANHLRMFLASANLGSPRVVPGAEADEPWEAIQSAARNISNRQNGGLPASAEASDTLRFYLQLLMLYDKGDKEAKIEFNDTLSNHLAALEKQSPALMRKIGLEVFLNDFAPFLWCWWVYVAIAVLGAASWFSTSWSPQLRRAAFWSMGVTFVVHTASIILRMYLSGKPPVTNLYSSAIFIGWGCVLGCLISEYLYRNAIATVVGSVTGFGTLIIAHFLSLEGDTMQPLVAVLDTNFWLATHVTCVTLGYTTAIVAGFMGIAYIGLGMFTDHLRGETSTNLSRATYGVLCAGMFLSFVGTVLGGLWADYSWGRFWGWDPKENGALLIVIWIALILHARWGGMVKARGIAVLSVIGIIVTGWSWFGTNFLGIGKHAYGGSKGTAMMILVGIDAVILGIAGLGLFPLEMWKSFSPSIKQDTPQAPG
jgi:ABC-type transport system involved in cytochrome c biogenesis permease subunit